MNQLLPIQQNTDVVSLGVTVGGDALPLGLALSHVEIVRQVNRIPYARLRIADGNAAAADFPVSADTLFVPGQEVTIVAGYHGEKAPIFAGIVVRQRIVVREGASWLEVECRDPAVKMTLTRRHRHFEEVTDSDVIAELVGDYELQADLAPTPAVHEQLLQYQASDWDFMIGRLDANGQLCAVEDGTIRSFVPALEDPATAEILFGTNMLELDAEFDARAQIGALTATSWDPAAQALQEAEASEPDWAGNGDLTPQDMVAATGREAEQIWHAGAMAADALQAWADGALLRSRLAGSRGRARFQGLASLLLGQTVRLSGVGARFNGGVLVTGIRHAFVDNDWTTDVEFGADPATQAERFAVSALPAAALGPAVAGLQIGIVTAIAEDPAGEYRIRVRIPVAGMDEAGVWARLATLDAGSRRGTIFRPEIDDEVVVGFLHDDPACPVLLGMLHSSARPPPQNPTDDNHVKGYTSRGGLTLTFDDEKKVLTLGTPGGNTVVLSDDDGGITLEDQNGNFLKMTADGIEISSAGALTIKAQGDLGLEGANVAAAAQAEIKLEGSASASLSSSGMLEISGALVTIN